MYANSFASGHKLPSIEPVTRIENQVENKKTSLKENEKEINLDNLDKLDYKTGNTKTINKFEITTFENAFNVYTNLDFNREAHSNENYVLLNDDLMIINTVEGKEKGRHYFERT